jgi:hypothetical protein
LLCRSQLERLRRRLEWCLIRDLRICVSA